MGNLPGVLLGLISAFGLGYLTRRVLAARDAQSAETRAQTMILEAERDAELHAQRKIGRASCRERV